MRLKGFWNEITSVINLLSSIQWTWTTKLELTSLGLDVATDSFIAEKYLFFNQKLILIETNLQFGVWRTHLMELTLNTAQKALKSHENRSKL
jgi:hypothetical protein